MTSHPEAEHPPQQPPVQPNTNVESLAIYAAWAAGALGGLLGLVLGLGSAARLPLFGLWSYATVTAIASCVIGAAVAILGYYRASKLPGQEWRGAVNRSLSIASFGGVVLVHSLLAGLATLLLFLVLNLSFRGLVLDPFWSVLTLGVTLGITAWVVFLSVSRLTTVRMSNLLMAFVLIGTIISMMTASEQNWWETHFSHLGTFGDLSSALFNGTLVVGGLLVTAFSIYVSNDMRRLVSDGTLQSERGPLLVASMFVLMGVMLAGVGIVPVHISLLVHNLFASGLAVAFGVLLIGGPWALRGLPLAYFLSSWVFLAAVIVSVVLFVVGFFGLTAFEIVVFALIFGWISVFIRFLSEPESARR